MPIQLETNFELWMCMYAIQVNQNIVLVFTFFGWEYTFNQLSALTTLSSLVMSL